MNRKLILQVLVTFLTALYATIVLSQEAKSGIYEHSVSPDVIEKENQRVKEYIGDTVYEKLMIEIAERNPQPYQVQWDFQGVSYRHYKQGRLNVLERLDESNGSWVSLLDFVDTPQRSFYYSPSPKISPSHTYIILLEDITGQERYQLSLINSRTQEVEHRLDNVLNHVVWHRNGDRFFYVQMVSSDTELALYQLFDFDLTTRTSELVYEFEALHWQLSSSSSSEYLILEAWLDDGTQKTQLWPVTSSGLADRISFPLPSSRHDTLIDHTAEGFYIRSDVEGAFEFYFADDVDTSWVLLSRPSQAEFESFQIFDDWVIIKQRENGVNQFYYYAKDDPQRYYRIDFPDENFLAWFERGSNGNALSLGYTSPTTPRQQVFYDLLNQGWINEPKPLQLNNKVSYQWIEASDGVKVPVTIISSRHKKEKALLFTVYGAYGQSFSPVYGSALQSLLDRGMAYVIVHVRGGGELGEDWHHAGSALNKQRGIQDFIDVVNKVKLRSSKVDHVYAMAESAGAVIVGAAVNQQPDLVDAMVLQVPYLDVVNSIFNEAVEGQALSHLSDWSEWVDAVDQKNYKNVYSYSPYQQLRPQKYPATLLIGALHDYRVPLWHAANYAEQLREMQQGSEPILLFTELDGGHAAGLRGRIQRNALSYAFLLKHLNN